MYGAQIKFGIGRQASANSWVLSAGSFFALPILTTDVGLEKQELISQNLNGRFEQGATYDGASNVAGTITFEATAVNLYAMLGAVVNYQPTYVTSGSLRTATFVPNTSDFSSTLVKAPVTLYTQFSDSNSAELYYDSQCDQLELTFSAGQFTKARVAVAGGTRLANGIGSLGVNVLGQDTDDLFPWNVASISLGGTAVGNFSDIKIALNENVSALNTINGVTTPFKFTRDKAREVTVSGTLYLTDRSQFNAFINATQQRLLVTATQATNATQIQSGYNNTLVVDVPQLKITQMKLAANGPGEVAVSFQARGLLDASSNYSIQFTTINTVGTAF